MFLSLRLLASIVNEWVSSIGRASLGRARG